VIIRGRSISEHGLGARLDSKIVGQGLRYVLAGVVVTAVYLLTTAALSEVFGIPIEISLLGGFAAAVGAHFTLQRLFVWARATPFALGIREQMGRYALVVTFQYIVTAISTSVLPGALGVPAVAVYLTVPLVLTAVNFIIFRHRVFHTIDE
jgi:putative flippase GtrA